MLVRVQLPSAIVMAITRIKTTRRRAGGPIQNTRINVPGARVRIAMLWNSGFGNARLSSDILQRLHIRQL